MRVRMPIAMKSTTNQCKKHVGYNSVAIFIRLAVVASKICEIPRNSTKTLTYSSSGSFKVLDLRVNRKRIKLCNFLLVINSNYGLSLTVFEILTHLARKWLVFSTPPFLDAPSRGTPCNINVIYTSLKVHLMGYNSVCDIGGLSSFV